MSIKLRNDLRLGEAKQLAHELARRAARDSAEALLERANQKVPRGEGELEASGHVVDGGDGIAAVVYDDPKARYLVAHPEWNYADGRSGRWLMEALDEGERDLGDVLVDSIRSGWPG